MAQEEKEKKKLNAALKKKSINRFFGKILLFSRPVQFLLKIRQIQSRFIFLEATLHFYLSHVTEALRPQSFPQECESGDHELFST